MPYVGRLFKSKTVSYRKAKLNQFSQNMGFKRASNISSSRMAAIVPISSRRRKTYGQSTPEIKFFDVSVGSTSNVTAVVTDLSTMAQGLTNITRVGNKIHIKSVALHAKMSNSPSTGVTSPENLCKWALILDKEPEAAAVASYNEIYTSNSPYAYNNLNNSDRFVILATGVESFDASIFASAVGFQVGQTKWVERFVPCDVNPKYGGTTAAQTSVTSNQLLLATVWLNTDTASSATWATRIRYTDE